MVEKTEEASPRKLKKARDRGQIIKAKDLSSSLSFAAGYLTLTYIMGSATYRMVQFFTNVFNVEEYIGSILFDKKTLSINSSFIGMLLNKSISTIFLTTAPVVIASILFGVISIIAISGVNLSFEVISFKLSKFNPIENIKSRFSKDSIVSILKQLLTALFVSVVVYNTVTEQQFMYKLTYIFLMQLDSILSTIIDLVDSIVKKVIIVIVIFAVIDTGYQIWSYRKNMMMDKHEAKQDYKESEGDPEIKNRRKELSRELIYSDGPIEASKKSTLLVTNPTHIAISIFYDPNNAPVPIITGKGSDDIAKSMISAANDSNVKVENNPDLAWKLFYIEIGDSAPVETFQALAKILQSIEKVQQQMQINPNQQIGNY